MPDGLTDTMTSMSTAAEPRLRIGELARFAAVSTRTVRFYHQIGLLPEPERDHAGHRLYDGDAVIRLVRIVALAQAGVPLGRVESLLAASGQEFVESVAEIDRGVERQIAHLREVRATLATLHSADRVALPPRLADLIDAIRADSRVPAHLIDYLRNSWVLAHALYGETLLTWLETPSGQRLFEAESIELTAATLSLAEVEPDDPRIDEHVAAWVRWILSAWSETEEAEWGGVFGDPRLNEVLDVQSLTTASWRRIADRIDEELSHHGRQVGWDLPPA